MSTGIKHRQTFEKVSEPGTMMFVLRRRKASLLLATHSA
jgi:hypothetical protein